MLSKYSLLAKSDTSGEVTKLNPIPHVCIFNLNYMPINDVLLEYSLSMIPEHCYSSATRNLVKINTN